MTAIPLVPSWDTPLQKRGPFPLGDGVTIPGGWEPQADRERKQIHYDPRAIPTPFARAEATRLVLARIDEASGHELAVRFRLLLLGVVSGVLTLEPDDLKHPRYDNLGRALLQVDPEARYFSQVRWTAQGRRGFGVTYYTSLFSPHARRADTEWHQLADAVRELEARTLQLIAQWRDVLARAGRWSPALRGCEWQRGVEYALAGVQRADDTTLLRDDARLVGPVWLSLPTGQPEMPVRTEPVYLPAYAPGWARQFLAACRLRPVRETDGDVKLVDAARVSVVTIRVPRSGADTDEIALGAGAMEMSALPRNEGAGELSIAARGGQPGLADLLEPVVMALEKHGRSVDTAHVEACPVLYPDPIRLLVQRRLWPDKSGARDALSKRLMHALIETGGSLDPARVEAGGGLHVELSGRVTLYVTDRFGAVDVLDLRALGYALWLTFVGDAEISGDLGSQLAIAETAEKLLSHTSDYPLEPREWIYARVQGAPPDAISRRTATLSRLLLAYPASDKPVASVAARAARAFVAWAHGSPDLPALGRPTNRYLTYRLPTGDELALAVDSLES